MKGIKSESARALLQRGIDPVLLREAASRRRSRTAILAVAAAFCAVLVGYLLPWWYTADASLTVDSGSVMPNGGVLGLAAQLGALSGASGTTDPQFYADLLSSRTVEDRILRLRVPVNRSDRSSTLLQLWGDPRLFGIFGDSTPTAASWEAARKTLEDHTSATVDPKTGVISFSVDGPSAAASKIMADSAIGLLNDLVISIRRQRATIEREFLEQRFKEEGDSLDLYENRLRVFYEQNRRVTSPELQLRESRIKRDIDRTDQVYAQLAQQLEQARIQEVRDTPAITVIDPPIAPAKKSSPHLSLLAATGLFFGTLVAILWSAWELLSSEALRLAPDDQYDEVANLRRRP